MEQHVAEIMREKNFAIMDIEYIRTSETHQCIRKLYILAKNGYNDLELELYPCVQYSDLDKRYQRSFLFCRKHIHKLSYYPQKYASPCSTVLDKVNTFIAYNGIDCILYKGGTIEKDFCNVLCIPSYNIECFQDLEKVHSHDPRREVNEYYTQLVELL